MKKVLFLLSTTVVMVLLFAPVALATHHTAMSTATSTATATATATASPTATATASASPTATATATATALPRSGGPPLAPALTLAASLALIASGVGALALLRRRVS